MKKNIFIIIGIIIVAFIAYVFFKKDTAQITQDANVITVPTAAKILSDTDGLPKPDSINRFKLDQFGVGVSLVEKFNIDIDNNGQMDLIVRTRNENGNGHGFSEYKITLNGMDITPPNFRTVAGADCALQSFKFYFSPFKVVKISRSWEESWETPTMASRSEYTISNGVLTESTPRNVGKICNVADLL